MNDLKRQLGTGGSVLIRAHGAEAGVTDHGVTGDQAAAVVAHDRDLAECEQVDHLAHRLDVLLDRHRCVRVESAGTG